MEHLYSSCDCFCNFICNIFPCGGMNYTDWYAGMYIATPRFVWEQNTATIGVIWFICLNFLLGCFIVFLKCWSSANIWPHDHCMEVYNTHQSDTANHCTFSLGRIIFITQKWNPLFSCIIHLDQMIDLKDLQNIYRIFAMNIKCIDQWKVALGGTYN